MNNGEKGNGNWVKVVLVILAVVLVLGLLGVGVVVGIGAVIRRTAEQVISPITQTNQTLATRVAQYMYPTPTVLPDPVTVIHEIRSLARLETIQYTVEKVITAESNQSQLSFLFGDKLIFVGHGRVIAGVDLAKLGPQDMWVSGRVLYVRLPPAEVFLATLDNDKSYVYNRDTGILSKGDINLETTARQAAEKEILQSAINDGILIQAQQNAESYLSRALRALGYPDVIFVYDHQATPVPTVTPLP